MHTELILEVHMNIQINNLTQAQVDMLTEMWTIDTFEDFESWFENLDPADQQQAELLRTLVMQEAMEELLTDCSAANTVLAKFRL
jgi:uncharacterized protein YukE